MEEIYLICEDSIEGVFTGIYDAYALKTGHEHTHIQIGEVDNYHLFAFYRNIIPDLVKTKKVIQTIIKRLGTETYLNLCRALSTEDAGKGQAVYKTVVSGITGGYGRHVLENRTDPDIGLVCKLSGSAWNEIHRMMEFIRFEELKQGILFSRIGPKCNVVSFVMPHFADRMPLENFIIYDEKRGIFGVHPAKGEWYLRSGEEALDEENIVLSGKEEDFRELFTMFCRTIAIKDRTNKGLQRQMLPLKYRDYMVEFTGSFGKNKQ